MLKQVWEGERVQGAAQETSPKMDTKRKGHYDMSQHQDYNISHAHLQPDAQFYFHQCCVF